MAAMATCEPRSQNAWSPSHELTLLLATGRHEGARGALVACSSRPIDSSLPETGNERGAGARECRAAWPVD